MSPEYGATCGFFPVDEITLDYLRLTGRSDERVALVEAYCKENMLWHDASEPATYSQVVELDLGDVEPSLAGPRRPQDRVPLSDAKRSFAEALGSFGVDYRNGSHDRAVADTFPASDPTTEQQPGGAPEPEADGPATATVVAAEAARRARLVRRRRVRARPRRGRDRGDHVVHEHVEPGGDDRRRASSPRRRSSAGSRASRG